MADEMIGYKEAAAIYQQITGRRARGIQGAIDRYPHLAGDAPGTVNKRHFSYFINARVALYGDTNVFKWRDIEDPANCEPCDSVDENEE